MPEGRFGASASDIYFTIGEFLQDRWRRAQSQKHMAPGRLGGG
jgi:hypothetical protein